MRMCTERFREKQGKWDRDVGETEPRPIKYNAWSWKSSWESGFGTHS